MHSGKKDKANSRHARRRARERFDYNLSEQEMQAIVKDIRDGKAQFIERQSITTTLWLVKLPNGSEAGAIYDHNQGNLRTLLSPEWTKREPAAGPAPKPDVVKTAQADRLAMDAPAPSTKFVYKQCLSCYNLIAVGLVRCDDCFQKYVVASGRWSSNYE